MTSTQLHFFSLLVTTILLKETVTLKLKNHRVLKKRDIWDEAISEWQGVNRNVNFKLAPTYGTLDSKTLQQLDESLKVMIGGILELDIPEGSGWDQLIYTLDTSPFMIKQERYYISKLEKISFSSRRFFGFGSDKSKREKYIYSWFTKLIGNVDILEATDIDVNSIAKMVSKITVGMIDNMWSDKTKKKTLMDLGILRFPDISKPFFSVYRINLFGKCTYETYIFHQNEKSEIVGLFQREIYFPDQDYIESLQSEFIDQLMSEVDDLFSDM